MGKKKDKIEFIDIDDTGVLERMVSDERDDRDPEPLNDEDLLDEGYAETGDEDFDDYDEPEEEPEYDSHVEAFENGGTDEEHAGSEVFQGEIVEDVLVDDIVPEDGPEESGVVDKSSSKKGRKVKRVPRDVPEVDEFADLDEYDEPEVFEGDEDFEEEALEDEGLPEIDDEFGDDEFDDPDSEYDEPEDEYDESGDGYDEDETDSEEAEDLLEDDEIGVNPDEYDDEDSDEYDSEYDEESEDFEEDEYSDADLDGASAGRKKKGRKKEDKSEKKAGKKKESADSKAGKHKKKNPADNKAKKDKEKASGKKTDPAVKKNKNGVVEKPFKEKDFKEKVTYIADKLMHDKKTQQIASIIAAVVLLLVCVIIVLSINSGRNQKNLSKQIADTGAMLGNVSVAGEAGLMAVADSKLAAKLAAEEEEEQQQEEDEQDDEDDEDGTKVKVTFTSLEKDLKIKFINSETDRLVTDTEFTVHLTDKNDKETVFKDSDLDGIIYETNVESGDYTVEIDPVDGLVFAEFDSKVHVEDKIVYEQIDVTQEIKTEAEVNVAAEDKENSAPPVVEEAPTISDTVEYVESSRSVKTGADEYEKISKDDIPDPAGSAMNTADVTLPAMAADSACGVRYEMGTVVKTSEDDPTTVTTEEP
ncbi:MAG: hypothetical protein K6A72_10610, partial [Lachnospiraceae bacterium]|nr:hypothetical protein [Lachnospiraceae bacterium]